MAGFEDLIRGTLRKHGDATPEARAAIYHSSRQALERMLSQNKALDLPAQSLQRQRLESAIADIEAAYLAQAPAQPPAQTSAPATATPNPQVAPSQPATPVRSPVQPAPAPYQPQTSASSLPQPPEPRTAPSARPEIQVRPGVDVPPIPVPPAVPAAVTPPSPPLVSPIPPQSDAAAIPPTSMANPADEATDGFDEAEIDTRDAYSEAFAASASRERKPYAKLLLWTIILAGLGVAAWWAFNFGPALIKQQLGGSVPNPGQTIESGQFLPDGEDGWVMAFNPSDDSINIESGGRGSAEIFQNDKETFVRLASNAGGSENNLRVLIPRGVMLPLKGEAVTIEVLIKSSGKTNHQFAVYCDFGDMGNCGRKRFTAADRVEAQIFDVLLNNADLAPDEDAYLNFNTDLAGEGRPVDIYSIRMRPNS